MMKTFNQYVESVEIEESRKSMSRLIQHFINDPYVIIMSVERNPVELGIKIDDSLDPTDKEQLKKLVRLGTIQNSKITATFRSNLKSYRSGYIPIEGSYVETTKMKDGTVEQYKFNENSQIIYCDNIDNDKLKDQLYDLCISYAVKTNQECILVVDKGFGFYVDPRTGKRDPIGMFHPEKLGEYYSTLVKAKQSVYYSNRNRDKRLPSIDKNFTFTTDVKKAQNTFVKILNQYRKHE